MNEQISLHISRIFAITPYGVVVDTAQANAEASDVAYYPTLIYVRFCTPTRGKGENSRISLVISTPTPLLCIVQYARRGANRATRRGLAAEPCQACRFTSRHKSFSPIFQSGTNGFGKIFSLFKHSFQVIKFLLQYKYFRVQRPVLFHTNIHLLSNPNDERS